jgi:hypothetical protein
MSGNIAGVRFLNALKVMPFTAGTEAALATLINDWITLNAGSRSFVQLDFVKNPSASVFSAFLTFTE